MTLMKWIAVSRISLVGFPRSSVCHQIALSTTTLHPNVGTIVAEYRTPGVKKLGFVPARLISPKSFS